MPGRDAPAADFHALGHVTTSSRGSLSETGASPAGAGYQQILAAAARQLRAGPAQQVN